MKKITNPKPYAQETAELRAAQSTPAITIVGEGSPFSHLTSTDGRERGQTTEHNDGQVLMMSLRSKDEMDTDLSSQVCSVLLPSSRFMEQGGWTESSQGVQEGSCHSENGKRRFIDTRQKDGVGMDLEGPGVRREWNLQRPDDHGETQRSWKEILFSGSHQELSSVNFCDGKRQKIQNSTTNNPSFGEMKRSWLEDDLEMFCHSSSEIGAGKSAMKISFPSDLALDTIMEYDRAGVVLYFMGRMPKRTQLREWAKRVLGEDAVNRFIFLGKGFFLALCKEPKFKFQLLEKGGAWGHGLFGMAMPWHFSFDPMNTFLHFCPVWVTFKELPVFLLPHMKTIAAKMGRVLYIPAINHFVHSRNLRICLLWDMKKIIPGAIEVVMGSKQSTFVEVAFQSFPTACYKCKLVGHFAKECPGNLTSMITNLNPEGCQGNTHLIVLDNACQETVSVENKELVVDLKINSQEVDMKDETSARSPTMCDSSHEHILNEKTTFKEGSSRKKQKKKRKKQSTRGNKENEEKKEDHLAVDQNDVIQQDLSKEDIEKIEEENGDSDVSLDKEVLEEGQKEDDGDERKDEKDTELFEVDKEVLKDVLSFLHSFYSKADHLFYIPATLQKVNKEWVVNACDRSWNLQSFFKDNNISPNLVVFETSEGDLQWNGKS